MDHVDGKTTLPVAGNSRLRHDDKMVCDIEEKKTSKSFQVLFERKPELKIVSCVR